MMISDQLTYNDFRAALARALDVDDPFSDEDDPLISESCCPTIEALLQVLSELNTWTDASIEPSGLLPKHILTDAENLASSENPWQLNMVSDKGINNLKALMPYARGSIDEFGKGERDPNCFLQCLEVGDLRRYVEHQTGQALA